MPPVGFEPTISAGERQKTYALDRAATGTGWTIVYDTFITANCPNIRLGSQIAGLQKHVMYETIYEGWNFNSGNYLFTTNTK